MTSFWSKYEGDFLEQGDYLPGCWIPIVSEDFAPEKAQNEISVEQRNLIIVTQSCDLANEKNHLAALCPIYHLKHWEQLNPVFQKKGTWETVRKGRLEGLHMLGAFENLNDNYHSLLVDFRQIFSLPVSYLRTHAGNLDHRWRLRPPFREHFSQAFARFLCVWGCPQRFPLLNEFGSSADIADDVELSSEFIPD